MPRKKDPCDPLAATIAEIALNLGSRPEIKDLDGVVAEMQKSLEGITRQMVVDSIIEASTQHSEVKSELALKLTALKREARGDKNLRQAIADLEQHVNAGTRPPKKSRQPAPREIERLRSNRDRLRKRLPSVTSPNAKSRIEQRILELEGHLQAGTLPSPKPRKATAGELSELRASRDRLMSALRKSEPALKKRYEESIQDLTERLETNQVVPPIKRKEAPVSKQLERLAFERDKLRRQINQRIRELKPKSIIERFGEPFNALRAIMTSFDLSAVARQGGFIMFGHPARSAKSIVPMLRAFASERAAHDINKEIDSRPNAPLYAKSKLYISQPEGASLSKKEEAFMSKWAEKIPFVKGSSRAYSTFLNKLRADSFDAMVAGLSKNGEATLEEAKAIANFVNVATGRGGLGSAEQAAVPLATLFFAPRYVTSRFQLLAGQPLFGGNARTRKMVAAEYARFLIGLGVFYSLFAAMGGDIEEDPRSTDFGKVKFGETRIDPLAGLSQSTVIIAQLASGKKKKASSGEVVAIRGEEVPFGGETAYEVATNFLRKKLAPAPGALVDVMHGKDVIGNEVTPGSAIAKLLTPLTGKDIYEEMEQNGVPTGTALGLMALFGFGVQTHQQKKSDKPAAPEKPKQPKAPRSPRPARPMAAQ